MKKQLKSIVAITAVVGSIASTGYVIAADKGSNVDAAKKTEQASDAYTQLELAERLISYGDKNKDAMALILAAKIKKSIPQKEVQRKKSTEGEASKDDNKADSQKTAVESVLKRAKKLAGKNKGLLAMVDTVSSMKPRGYVRGPTYTRNRVLARSTDVYRMTFKGGETARILVVGDHDTDLDLFVYDENNNQICKHTDSSDTMYCRWRPRWTGQFKIKIKNYGKISNIYTMRSN